MNEPNDGLQRLKDFSLRMKHDLELVEAKAPAINDLVEQLSMFGRDKAEAHDDH